MACAPLTLALYGEHSSARPTFAARPVLRAGRRRLRVDISKFHHDELARFGGIGWTSNVCAISFTDCSARAHPTFMRTRHGGSPAGPDRRFGPAATRRPRDQVALLPEGAVAGHDGAGNFPRNSIPEPGEGVRDVREQRFLKSRREPPGTSGGRKCSGEASVSGAILVLTADILIPVSLDFDVKHDPNVTGFTPQKTAANQPVFLTANLCDLPTAERR